MTAMSNDHKRFYEFGDFRIDAEKRLLRRNGELITLPPKVFDTLALLVSRSGEVLTKSEMLDEIWHDAFVEEGNLTQNIYLLRRTLGKTAEGKDWIETLPRKGYVFTGDVNGHEPDEKTATKPKNDTARFGWKMPYVVFAVLLLVGSAAFFVYAAFNSRGKESGSGREISLQKLTFSGDVEFSAIAPDGNSFAFTRNGRLFVQQAESSDAREIVLPQNQKAGFVQFSPDGSSILFRDQRRFYRTGNVFSLPLNSAKPEKVIENVWSGFGFSPDGRRVAFIRDIPEESRHQLIVKDLVSKGERVLSELTGQSRFIFISGPAWSPDARHIAAATLKLETRTPRTQLSVFDVDSGTSEDFAPPQLRQFEQAVWMPDGSSIAVIAREAQKFFQVWAITYPLGKVTRITNDLNSYRQLSISTDGKRLLSANYQIYAHVWAAQADNLREQRQLTFGNLDRDGTIGMAWLNDGSIVYSSRVFGNVDLWRAGPSELEKAQLTREAGEVNSYPQLAPDGRTIYFSSNRTGTTQIWQMRAGDGGEQTQITFGEKETNELPQVSPDGKWLYFVKKTATETAIWRRSFVDNASEMLPIDGRVTPESFLAMSPDGRYLATCNLTSKSEEGADAESFQIAIVSTERRERPRVISIPREWMTWSPDGSSIDYAEYVDGNSRVLRMRLDGSGPGLLVDLPGEFVSGLKWKQDGTSLAISRGKRGHDVILITNFLTNSK